MNHFVDLGPDHVAVDLEQLQVVLALLNESRKLHDGGYYEAHAVQERARRLLGEIITKATE